MANCDNIVDTDLKELCSVQHQDFLILNENVGIGNSAVNIQSLNYLHSIDQSLYFSSFYIFLILLFGIVYVIIRWILKLVQDTVLGW
jgi:hypothetical protein